MVKTAKDNTAKDKTPQKPITGWRKRQRVAQPVGALLDPLTRRAFAQRGFENPAVIEYWPAIVGERLAERTRPQRIAFPRNGRTDGVLHVTVLSPSLATEIQHDEPRIIERINAFFGYRAVRALRLVVRFDP